MLNLSAERSGLSLFKRTKQWLNAFTLWYWCTIEYLYSQNECHISWNINAYWKWHLEQFTYSKMGLKTNSTDEQKIYQISKDICKRVVWFSVLAPRRQQPLYGQPPNEFCACAFQKQLVWISHLNSFKSCEDQPIWMIFITNFCRNLWPFSISLFDIITNLWIIYEV